MTGLLILSLLASCRPDAPDSALEADPSCALGQRQQTWAPFCPEGHDLLAWVDPRIRFESKSV